MDFAAPPGRIGVLVNAPRSWLELIYASQADGFALLSARTPQLQRMYLQCRPDDDVAACSDARIWEQPHSRLDTDVWTLTEGNIVQRRTVPLRSFVRGPMQCGRLFLAGDAAHIVPPAGAKGLNLAVADVLVLARALDVKYRHNSGNELDRYSTTCLRRVWKAERFSWYMTTMLHHNHAETQFERRIHRADLDLIRTSRAAAAALAENHVGLPFDGPAAEKDRSQHHSGDSSSCPGAKGGMARPPAGTDP